MAIGAGFEHTSALQCKVRALSRRIEDFESGAAYADLAEEGRLERKRAAARIKELEAELGRQRRTAAKMRNCWFEVYEQVERERDEAIARAFASVRRMEERALRAERRADGLMDAALLGARRERELMARIEELEGRCAKLTSQVNKDFLNSSLPSSAQGPARKKIPNTRTATGRKPGAQPGHAHHPRKKLMPTRTVEIADPGGFADNPDLHKTQNAITKQVVSAKVTVEVIEYVASVWRRRSDGSRLHAPFPDGVSDDVTYDGSVKALAFLLTNECCVSQEKAKAFLREASGGVLDLSCGMICGLTREFSAKCGSERAEAVSSLMASPVMHADFTCANVSGTGKQVLVLANKDNCAMLARDSKGHKGVQGSPLEKYVGCVVHDHEKTFYSYGTSHQECMQHNIRYLVGSTQNETERTWNTSMLALLREMLAWRRLPASGSLPPDPNSAAAFEQRYDEILGLAASEYGQSPPSKYYREGYNLCLRLRDYKDSELQFLHNTQIPPDNSLCERLARIFKRKQRQAIAFRSFESLGCICEAIATINNMRCANKNVFAETSAIFGRHKADKGSTSETSSAG